MKKLLIFGVIIYFTLSCAIRAPEVRVTGEKTALENQVIGTYRQIEEDSWAMASTRAFETGQKVTLSMEKKKVLEAVRNRKFNKDDIDEFKRDGVVGENNQGFLEIRPSEKLNDPEYKELVLQLIQEENRDREIIMNRVMEINEAAAKAGNAKVYAIFARLSQDNSASGTWVQLPDGSWVRKGK